MIAIVNYGSGNVQALANVYRTLDVPFMVASSAAQLSDADGLILPGVGAFDEVNERLDASGMRPRLDELVLQERRPVLGICVGMQLLADRSEEGTSRGLGWIAGEVRLMQTSRALPHMGWNSVETVGQHDLMSGVDPITGFYFLHAYCFSPADTGHEVARTSYGDTFSCVVNRANVYGVQFHPEKSHKNGVRMLQNFADLVHSRSTRPVS